MNKPQPAKRLEVYYVSRHLIRGRIGTMDVAARTVAELNDLAASFGAVVVELIPGIVARNQVRCPMRPSEELKITKGYRIPEGVIVAAQDRAKSVGLAQTIWRTDEKLDGCKWVWGCFADDRAPVPSGIKAHPALSVLPCDISRW